MKRFWAENPVSLNEVCMTEIVDSKKTSLQFAVMCNGPVFQKWQAEAIRLLRAHGHELVLMITDARTNSDGPVTIHKSRRDFRKILYSVLENRMFKPEARESVDMSRDLDGIDTLRCNVIVKGCSEYFYDSEIEAIRTFRLDFILRFGFRIIRGNVLTAARFGVWSFHHGDEMKYRGGPAGFWEIFKGDRVSGAILQQLTEKLDAGIILKKGYLRTIEHSFKGNVNQLLSVTSAWPAQVADEIVAFPGQAYHLSNTGAPVFRLPGNIQMIRFLIRIFLNRIRFYYKELVAAEVWNVGLIRRPIHEVALGNVVLKPTDIQWLRHFGETKYLADPFGFIDKRKLHIMLEDYSYSRRKATISEIIYDLRRDSFSVPIRIIEGKEHLSYPCVVEHDGNIFCIPESYRSKNVVLYKRNYSEEAFIEENVILPGIEAVDPTVFLYENRWWLFLTVKQYSTTHLYVYFADRIEGPYTPHRRNPVKIDIRSARPGGVPFIHEGVLYRPAQNCSVTYGGSIVINKVLKLTPDEFYEETINSIEPVKGSQFSKGLHTLSKAGDYTLIDGKKYQINRFFFMSQINERLNKEYIDNV